MIINLLKFIFILFCISVFALFIAALFTELDGGWVADLLGIGGEKSAAIEMIGLAAAGLIAIAGIWIANRRAKALEDQAVAANIQAIAADKRAELANRQAKVADKQAEVANKQAEVANEGNREKRLVDGVEHLGSQESSARLGGAYGLYQLAQDYWQIGDQQRSTNIIDILHAHIRQTTSNREYQKAHEDQPSEEIQSMLGLLFKPSARKIILRGTNQKIDLSRSWLRGASLHGAKLQNANLKDTQLQGANLTDAQLQKAYLENAQLQGANLADAQLQAAFLRNAQLQGVIATAAQLRGADLMGVRLQGAFLKGAQLQGALLVDAQLQMAPLGDAQLQGALLEGAQLQGTGLKNTHLHGVHSKIGDHSIAASPFEDRIQKRVECESDLQNIIFSGGIEKSTIEETTKAFEYVIQYTEKGPMPRNIREERLQLLRRLMKGVPRSLGQHLGKPASNKPPSEAIIGSYSQEDANRWIKEYEEATNQKKWNNENAKD